MLHLPMSHQALLGSAGEGPQPNYGMNKHTNKNSRCGNRKRPAMSKQPDTPSEVSKNNGCHTTNQLDDPSRHPTTETANSMIHYGDTIGRLGGSLKQGVPSLFANMMTGMLSTLQRRERGTNESHTPGSCWERTYTPGAHTCFL